MSRRLPVISDQQLVKALKRAGFEVLRQRGSHVSMEKREPETVRRTVIPSIAKFAPAH